MRISELLRSRSGKINWVQVVLAVVLILGVYAGIVFYPVFSNNNELDRFVQEQVLNSGVILARDMEKNIRAKAEELGIETQDMGVSVLKGQGKINIDVQYKWRANFLGMPIERDRQILIKNADINIPESLGPGKNPVSDN